MSGKSFMYGHGESYRGERSAQALTILAGLRQAGAHPLPQNLPLELREDSEQSRHGPADGLGGFDMVLKKSRARGHGRAFRATYP
jgi:hypothetical protein